MTKPFIRFGMMQAMISAGLIASAAMHSRADQTPGQLARELRWALGFDAVDMAALGIGAESYQTMVTSAISYCQSHTQDVQAQLASLRQARATLFGLWEVNDGSEASEQAIAAAKTEINSIVNSIQQAFGALTTTLRLQLSPTNQGLQIRIATHRLVDPVTAALDLAEPQLTAISVGQHLRDRTRLHCIYRALPSIVAVSDAEYEATVDGILSAVQQQTRAALVGAVNQRVREFSQIDEQHP